MPVGKPQQSQQHIQQQQIHPQKIQQQQQPLLLHKIVHPQMRSTTTKKYSNIMVSTHLQEKEEVPPQLAIPQLPLQTHLFSGSVESEPVATSLMNNFTQQNYR